MEYINSDNLIKFGEILVSIAGLLIAWVVFRLQAGTFESQLEVTKLSQKKFLYDIRPEFSMSKQENFGRQIVDNLIYIGYDLTLNKNIAVDFYILNLGTIKSEFDDRKIQHIQVNQVFDLFKEQSQISVLTGYYNTELWFKDEVGTQYKQIIVGNILDLRISPPIQVL